MRLVRAEAARLLSRRLTWVSGVALAGAVAGVVVALTTAGAPVAAGDTYRMLGPLFYFLTACLGLFGFLLGASFAGAELTSGAVAHLLLWRPDRTRVFTAKLAVVLGTVLVAGLLGVIAVLVAWWAVTDSGLSGPRTIPLISLGARGVGLAVVVAGVGFAAAVLGRRTSAALGLAVTYLVLWEFAGRTVVAALQRPDSSGWFLTTHLMAWLQGEAAGSALREAAAVPAWLQAGMVLLALFVVCVGAAAVVFRHRDVA